MPMSAPVRSAAVFPLIAVLLASSACAPKKKSRFPKPEALRALEAQPVPTPDRADPISDVDTWKLQGPLPSRVEAVPRAGTGPWDALLADATSPYASLRRTEAMHCVARELGRFELSQNGRPAEDLQRYVVARCGVGAASVIATSSTIESLDDRATDEGLAATSRDVVQRAVQQLAESKDSTPLDVGLWFGREGSNGLLMIAACPRRVDIEPASMGAEAGGRIVVRGTVRIAAMEVTAAVNRGRFEAKECVRDESVELPGFAFVCETDPADEEAWIELGALPPDRVLGYELASLLVAPGGASPSDTYRRPGIVGGAAVKEATNSTELAAGFLQALNAVRTQAGLLEVRATDAQTAVANRVAPHFFAAAAGLQPEAVADTVALGMLAGWNVDGIVHDGLLTSAWTGHSTDPRRLLASMLDSPGGRTVLLDRDADVIALGTVLEPERRFLGALVTVYRLYEFVSPEARAKTVREHIAKERAKKGLSAPAQIEGLSADVLLAVSAIEQRGTDPQLALSQLLQRMSNRARKPVHGWVLEAHALDEFELPPNMLDSAFLPIELAIAYRKPKGEPWGRWVILVVTFAESPA